jgi:DNA-directed RNA polymerase specialized sigma24 family protein
VAAWLIKATRYVALAAHRRETLLKRREQKAAAMHSETQDDPAAATAGAGAWLEIAPRIDAAVARLGEADRTAVTLRFFKGLSVAR